MRRRWEAPLYAALPLLYLLLFFALPLLAVIAYAAGAQRGLLGLVDLARNPLDALLQLGVGMLDLFGHEYYRNRITFTIYQAILSTLLTLAAGLPLAYVFSHHRFPGRRLLRALFTAPFVLPAIVVALALYAYVGPRSLIGLDLLTPLGPLGAILVAHTFYNTSLVLRLVGNYWERLPPRYAEAARAHGAGPWTTLWRVDLPMIRPAIVAATLLVFVFTLTSFGIILLLRGSAHIGTIETLIYELLRGFRPLYNVAAALALLQLVITYAALLAFVLVQRRLRVSVIPRTDADRTPLPAWGWALLGTASLFLVGPPLALIAASFRYEGSWSLEAYRLLGTNAKPLGAFTASDAVTNSLTFAIATLVLALLLAWLAALAVHRARGAAWAEGLLLLPLGLSSIVVGLGFLLTWDGRGLPDLRTSPWRIVLAHTLIAFPFATRILAPTLDAVEPRLREAAHTLGAGPVSVLARIDFPLSYPALGVAAVYAFGASLGEFGAALVLRRPETTTLPLAIHDGFARVGAPFHAQANALAALLLVVAVVSFLLLERLRVRSWGDFA